MKRKKCIEMIGIVLLGAILILPLVYMIAGSSGNSLYQVFLRRPDYLLRFWKTLAMDVVIVSLNVMFSCMAGVAFAKYDFHWKRGIYLVLMVLMILPIQAMLVPSYIVLKEMHLLNTWAALALPCVFHPFGAVWMTQIFRRIPDEVLDAAKMDGANTWQILWKIMVPAGKGGVVTLILLTFVDVWNMVEQPIVFLENSADYPLSVFLAILNETDMAVSFTSGLLSVLPVLLLLLYCRGYMVGDAEQAKVKKQQKHILRIAISVGMLLFVCTVASSWIYDALLPRVTAMELVEGEVEGEEYPYVIPAQDVYTDVEGNYVYRIRKSGKGYKVEQCRVKILAQNEAYVAIWGYLDEEDLIAISPTGLLRDGEAVKLEE